jgi:hypothetical protein
VWGDSGKSWKESRRSAMIGIQVITRSGN